MNFCRDCIHFNDDVRRGAARCMRGLALQVDPVYGTKRIPPDALPCNVERTAGLCGSRGLFFERRRPTLLQRIAAWLRGGQS